MKYIRTNDGVFELVDTYYTCVNGVETYMYNDNGRGVEIKGNQILKQADNLAELCDVFKTVFIYAGQISFTDYLDYELARFNKSDDATLYGYIYITLPNGTIRIEPVAKMNESGELELL